MVNKVQRWFSDIWDRMKTSVRVKPDSIFVFLGLILIIVMGVLIRLSPIFRGAPLIKAFDPWIQYYSTSYLVENGVYEYFNWHDFMSWYPEGIARYNLRPGLVFATGILYNFLRFFGINVTLYEVAYFWPAIMGGFTILAMFYLGREILDSRCGLLAAFFIAFSPGHIQRTIAGFFDNETIGVFAVLMTFLFFIRSVKTDKMYNSIISGMFLGFLSLSWGGLSFGFLLLPLSCLIVILVGKYSARLLISYVGSVGTGLLIYMVNPTFNSGKIMADMEIAIPVLFLFFMVGYHFLHVQKRKNPKVYKIIWSIIKWGTIPALIIFGVIFWFAPDILPFGLGARAQSILNPSIREAINLVASVGEHKPSPWSVFYYNTLIPVILTPLGVFFAIKRNREEDILMLVFALTLLYFTGSMIRIILLLSPALSLIGAYGLTHVLKFFGSLMKKQQTITRRRKRQIRQTLGAAESAVIFVLVGFMFFAQINHATTISIEQMSFSELVTANSVNDWEESLSFISENLDSTSVVVSWWDYGYWLTVLGNVTTVNDNGTLNHTRLGLTGMAMMQTNELYSAKIFKQLKADYVLVFFGFLINQFGGDEGKWPWMLRICNDYSTRYESWGLAEDNWYYDEQDQLISVFNEEEYINASTGRYEDKWFDSTLVKLMFYQEPTSLSSPNMPQDGSIYAYLANQYASLIEGNEAEGTAPRTDDNGVPWANHIPPDGDYVFKTFQKYYFSTNHLVKIYKMDYTALESSFELKNPKLTTKGYAHVDVVNTGERSIKLTDASLNDKEYNFIIEDDDFTIEAGENKTIWFDTNKEWETSDDYKIEVTAEADKFNGLKYTFSNDTERYVVVDSPAYDTEFDRVKSHLYVEDYLYFNLTLTNTGDGVTTISHFEVNGDIYDRTNLPQNHNYVLNPGETEEYILNTSIIGSPGDGNTYQVYARTNEGFDDGIELTGEFQDYRLSILPLDRYMDYGEIGELNPDTMRNLHLYNDDTILYENGTLEISVKNNGKETLYMQSVLADDIPVAFDNITGNNVLIPGETEKFTAQLFGVTRNTPVKIVVTASGQGGYDSASDTVRLIPIYDGAAIEILEMDQTSLYTNEQIEIAVRNVGNQVITLEEYRLLGSTFNLSTAESIYGSPTLNPLDVYKFKMDVTGRVKLNESDTISLTVYAESGTVFDTKTLDAELPIGYDFIIDEASSDTRGIASTNRLQLDLIGTDSYNLTIDSIMVNGTYVDLGEVTFDHNDLDINNISPDFNTIVSIPETAFGLNVVNGYFYEVTIITEEGPKYTALVEGEAN